jgi:hypothetical protein
MRAVSHVPVFYYDKLPVEEPGFRLNLPFLARGTDFYPLSELSAYERYLIFLKYKEDRNILEIAQVVQKSKMTVQRHLKRIHTKLRSYANEDTR